MFFIKMPQIELKIVEVSKENQNSFGLNIARQNCFLCHIKIENVIIKN